MDNTPDKKENEKSKEVYKTPKSLEEMWRSLYKSKGLGTADFKGFSNDGQEELAEWKIPDGTARYPKAKQSKIDRKKKPEQALSLIPTPPKLGVSQAKNIDALGFMLQRENWKREKAGEPKKAELEFALKDYAKTRGYNDANIARGGKFLDELKRDLFTGAYTTYRLDKVMIDGKEYTAHGLPNIYVLLEPKNKKDNWKIVYNEPYKNYYINGGQYYPILLEAIKDKGTDHQKGYLYFFFKLVMSYASTGDFKTQPKVSTLLDKIKVGDQAKTEPTESFKVLCECIYYTATNYKINDKPAITEVRFFESGKCRKVKVITDLEKFKSWSYESFKKEVLAELGLTDIRDALISFNTQKELTEGTGETGQTGQDTTTL
jgi:hypothetical protein